MASSSPSSDEATHTNETMTNDLQYVVGEHIKKQRGTTMMDKLTKVHNLGVKLPVEFSVFNTAMDGPNSSLFKSYVVLLGRGKVSILLDDWKDVSNEVKNSIWTDVQVVISIVIDLILRYINTNTYLLSF